eukprot:160291_1
MTEIQLKAPILYITGGSDYKGVLLQNECDNTDLWNELMERTVLQEFKQNDEKEEDLKIIKPFRMVIHKLENLKMVQINGSKGASKCQHFTLLWVPTWLKPHQYKRLIKSFRNSSYFCNKLNKDCVYISGPEYGHLERNSSNSPLDATYVFDLDVLKGNCSQIIDSILPKSKTLSIEICVHELAKEHSTESIKPVENINDIFYFKNVASMNDINDILPKHESVKINMKTSLLSEKYSQHKPKRFHRSFGGSINNTTGPLPTEGFDPIYDRKSGLVKERFVFAIVWLHVTEEDTTIPSHKKGIKIRDYDDDDDDKYDNKEDNDLISELYSEDNNLRDNEVDHIQYELPAWAIMKKLHQQPYKKSLVYNVELFNCDECWQNQDLVVDRKILWKEAFLVFIQAYLLPISVVFPPIKIIKCFNKKFNLKPRCRPVEEYIHFRDLDRIEQIPYDITALWGGYYVYDDSIIFRFVSFIITCVLWCIIFIGPCLYQGKPGKKNDVNNFVFFDCFASLIFYTLSVFTVIWWACARRVYIWPKQHELLYFRLIVNRPIHRKRKGGKSNTNIRRTDWAAVSNISSGTTLTTFIYAFRKGFLELKTPIDSWFSLSLVRRSYGKIFITSIVNLLLYFFAHNLERIEMNTWPIYMSGNDTFYAWKLLYNICSIIFSCIFVFGFILLWETMFDRMNRHLDTVKTLSNLLVRNTYSEYIKLSKSDNILSWLVMERFLKRKGMMLFSSLETPLFALALLSISSWAGFVYCFYLGVGQRLINSKSTFSNSALATWLYLGLFSGYQLARMLFWYGRKFARETEKLQNSFKRSCKTLHIENLMEYEVNKNSTLESKYAMKSSQYILTHSNHNEIIPKVFGIQFDKLTAKAAWGLLIGALPTIIKIIIDRASLQ